MPIRLPARAGRPSSFLRSFPDNSVVSSTTRKTIELKSNFLSSARVGERVACRCTPAHLGRQTHVWDATVTNETTGRTMALFRCTQMVLQPK
jgi:1,4-dihydroxy-2-naphthoyl-CoA hydrolase